MPDLTSHIVRAKLSAQIVADIEAESKAFFAEDPRTHLGASIMGKPCRRQHWSTFRWLKQEQFSGRMHRLFKRGHREEPFLLERLRAIGFVIHEVDPETGKQFRITGAGGHYGGSGDGLGYAPERYGITGALVIEYKTHNEKSFAKLAGKIESKVPDIKRVKPEGVRKSKPEHFAQMSQYGRAYNLKYGVYVALNKETDEIYIEFVELDWKLADSLFRDAEAIILSQTPPPKIAETIAFFDCKYCAYGAICHAGEVPEKNCRSCAHARPVDNAEWFCEVHKANIPKEFIPQGCDSYRRIV